MNKKEFDRYFWKIMDKYLHNSLSPWQIERIKEMVEKAITKGKKISN